MGRFRYRLQAILDAADVASRSAARAHALARRDVRRASLEVERARSDGRGVPSPILSGRPGVWLVRALDCDRWSAWSAMRERACVDALEQARRVEEGRRADHEAARRRCERLGRHRDRAREAFEAEAVLGDERERDEANARVRCAFS